MIACIDVGYGDTNAIAAAVTIGDWADATPLATYSVAITKVEEYVPGEFYKRELPCIQAVLAQLPAVPDVIVIDGYVWLDEHGKQGLGARLYDALDGQIPVVGVAKTSFATATNAVEVHRGGSSRPLFITAVGYEIGEAVDAILGMHGNHRIPTMLTLVDQLSKSKR